MAEPVLPSPQTTLFEEEDDDDERQLPFIVGAGVARTGTSSLRIALNQLGYKTFHMRDIIGKKVDATPWFDLALAERHGYDQDEVQERKMQVVRQILNQGYNATTDFPAALVYKELLALRPNAKVILTIRSSPQAWSSSVKDTIEQALLQVCQPPISWIPHVYKLAHILHPWTFEAIGTVPFGSLHQDKNPILSRDDLERAYTLWIQDVKDTVPPHQLLIHKPEDGFRPICQHLGISLKNCPPIYPHVNDRGSIRRELLILQRVAQFVWSCSIILGVVLLVRLFRKVGIRRRCHQTVAKEKIKQG
jgi:Sulfotransferase domain